MSYVNNAKKYTGTIMAISVIVLLVGLSYLNTKRQGPELAEGTTTQTDKLDSESEQADTASMLKQTEKKTTPQTQEKSNPAGTFSREGVLLTSDNPSRGNLMLKTQQSVFYLRTSRDFSSLIGKQATVTANGTVEQFSLMNITENK
jgi:hypothetical protein